jgi:hypothetical protein
MSLKKVKLIPSLRPVEMRYKEDVNHIVAVLASHKNIEISRVDANAAWDAYSDSMEAGWMRLCDDDYIWALISPYVIEVA